MLPIAISYLPPRPSWLRTLGTGTLGTSGTSFGKPVYLVRKRGLVGCMSQGRGWCTDCRVPRVPPSPPRLACSDFGTRSTFCLTFGIGRRTIRANRLSEEQFPETERSTP